MSNVLDDNVVILRFDNSDFEKNTKQSMDTLDKLKNSVNKTSGESLEGLGKAANEVNLSGLSKAIDTVNKRFSLFGMAGMATIGRLTNSAITSASKIITAIPKQAIQGGWQRALNLEQAQFLIEGLGFTWKNTAEQAAKGMTDVYTVVDRAVTGTRYALDEAAGVASQLLSAGVTDMNKLEVSLKAISGVASVTNAEYSDIGRIFAQVKGQGRMMGDDLLQLQQRNIDATAAIREYLNLNKEVGKQALDNAIAQGRQANKMKEIREQSEFSINDIRSMVSAGAIDFDILSNSFFKFFKQAEKANDTYTGSLANLKSAINRIGESFMKVKLTTFTKLFNALIPIFKRVKELTDPLAKKIEELSVTFTDFAINGVINPLGKMMGAKNLFKFGKAAEDAGKKVDKANEENQKSSKKSREEILKLNKEYQAARDIWYKGTYGNGANRKNALEELKISYEGTQAIINQFYADGFKWDKIEEQLIADYNERTDASEEAADATKKETKQYPTMIALLKGFVNILTSAKLALEGIGNILKFVGSKIKEAILSSLKTGANGFSSFSEKILEAAKRFKNFSEVITDTKKRTEWLENHKGIKTFIQTIQEGFSSAKQVLTDFIGSIKEFFSQFSETEGFQALKEQIKELGSVVKDLAGGALKTVVDRLGDLSNVGTSSNMTRVVNFFSGIASGLANMIASIRRGENPLKGFVGIFGSVKDALSFKSLKAHGISAGINALSAKNGTVAMVVNATKSLKSVDIPGTFKTATESISNFFEGLSKKAKDVDVKGGFQKIFEAFKKADWESISKIAFRIGSLAAVFKTIHDMSRLVDSAVGTLGSISGFFGSLSNVANTYASQMKVQNFQLIAISVAILIGSIIALAAVPVDRLKPAVAGVVVILGMLAVIMALMSSKKFNPQAMTQVGASFAAMGASLLLVAMACKVLASISADGLFKAGTAIIAFMGMFILAGRMKGQILQSGAAFLAMAGAVNLLVVAVMAFAIMPWSVIMKGATAIALIMTELSIAARIAASSNPSGLLAMALALDLLIPAIVVFAVMPYEMALKGAVVTCTIIAMLGLASRTAGSSAGNMMSLVGMATMVIALAAALVVLSMIDTSRLLTATTALVTTMLSLAAAAAIANKSKVGLLTMSLAIGMIAASIIALIKIDAQSAIEVANSLSVLAASLSIAFGMFSLIGVKGSAIATGGITIAIAGITAIIMALGKLYEWDKARELIANGKKFAEQLGDAIGSFVGGIISGVGVAATAGLGTMADNISDFAEKIQPFLDTVNGIDASKVDGAKNLANAILQLTKADFIEGLSLFSDITGLATKMQALGDGFVAFSAAVDEVPPETAEKAGKIADIVSSLATAFKKIPKDGGIARAFTGWVDIDSFVDGLLTVAKALSEKKLGKIEIPEGTSEKVEKIAEVMGTLSEAIKKIPPSGGLQQALTGDTTLSGFAIQLSIFAEAMPDVITNLEGIVIPDEFLGKGGKIDQICQVMAQMSESASTIPPSGGLKQVITGNTTISEFAWMLALAVPGISFFIKQASSITIDETISTKIDYVAKAITAMATASQELPESGGFKQLAFGSKDISDFASQLSAAIPSLQTFSEGLTGVNFGKGVFGDGGKLSKVVEAIKAMAGVANALPRTKGWAQKLVGEKNLGKFGKQLSTLMSSLSEVGDVTVNPENIKNTATALTAITPAITTFKEAAPIPKGDNLVVLGNNVASFVSTMANDVDTSGISGKATAISNAVKSLGKATKVKASSMGSASSYTKAGAALGTAYANGIKSKVGDVKKAVKSLGDAAGAKSLGSASDFKKAGTSLAKGFVDGIKSKKSDAKSAGKSLGKNAKDGSKSVSLYKGGQNVGQGFVDGIKDKKTAAYKAGYALGKAAKQGQKDATGESSPAKEFIKGGKYAGEGLVIGLKSYRRKVYKAGYDTGSESVTGQNDGIVDALGGLTGPVITPVIDLSEVRNGINTIDNELSRNRAYGVNSTFETSDYRTNRIMNDVVKTLNKMNNSKQPTNNYFTFNVDGAENPEDFAKRFVRQVELEMRTG